MIKRSILSFQQKPCTSISTMKSKLAFLAGKLMTLSVILAFTATTINLSGCAAAAVSISKRKLNVKTEMSRTVWLDPVADHQKTVYIQLRNTSDQPQFSLQGIQQALRDKGYRVYTNHPRAAHYWLQVNILRVAESSISAAERSARQGSSSMLGTAVAAGAAGAIIAPSSPRAWLGAGLVGAAVSLVADNAVKDVVYAAITDIRLSVQKPSGKGFTHYKRRVVSTAEKVNLKFQQAEPALEKGLVATISGIFA